jgi:hypothetical protein
MHAIDIINQFAYIMFYGPLYACTWGEGGRVWDRLVHLTNNEYPTKLG